MNRLLVTAYDPPPIADRRFDWKAYRPGDDEEGHHVGYGRTEAEAIADLKRLDDERADYVEWQAEQSRAAQ